MKYITQICKSMHKGGGAELYFRNISAQPIFQNDIKFRQSIILNKNNFDADFANTFAHPVRTGNLHDVEEAINNGDIILFWGDLKLNNSKLKKPQVCVIWSCTEDALIIENNKSYITHAIATSKKTASITCYNIDHIISFSGLDYNNLNTNISRYDLRKKLNILEDDFVLGMIARIGETKRQRWLLDAVNKIKNKKIKAIFVGDGDKRKYLEQLRVPNCLFVGHKNDVGNWYQILDAFCILSRNEGAPATLFESFYMKIPVIHTDVGMTQELCNCTNSFLVKSKDELPDVINHVYKLNKNAKDMFTDNAYELYEKHGKIEFAATQWYNFFKNIKTVNCRSLL